jgi:hypothetical protein
MEHQGLVGGRVTSIFEKGVFLDFFAPHQLNQAHLSGGSVSLRYCLRAWSRFRHVVLQRAGLSVPFGHLSTEFSMSPVTIFHCWLAANSCSDSFIIMC